MKLLSLFFIALFVSGCRYFQKNIEISGTATGMDGGIVSILDLSGQPVYTTVVNNGKFHIKPQSLANTGYYTFSISSGKYPRDFEIYLEPGKYAIDVPKSETDYLTIKTGSKTQNSLSAYYNFEDSVMVKFHNQVALLTAQLSDPKSKQLPEADYEKLLGRLDAAQAREHGATAAIMSMYVEKYPQNEAIPHIITNNDYLKNPFVYYSIYQKLSPAVKNTAEGKEIGHELDSLNKAQVK